MKLGVHIGYWGLGLGAAEQLQLVQEAERLGYDSVWTAEAYGSDAATILAWLAQATDHDQARRGDLPDARPLAGDDGDDRGDDRPALGRADAARDRLQRPAGGRGLARPALREAAAAHARVHRGRADGARPRAGRVQGRDARAAAARRPRQGAQADDRARAGADARSTWPRSGRRTRRWPPRSPTAGSRRCSRPSTSGSSVPLLEAGLRGRGRRQGLRRLRHRAHASTCSSPTTASPPATRCATYVALYVGGMGSRKQNFYNALVQRYGFEDAAREVQDLYLEGKKDEAAAALPGELIDSRLAVRAARRGARAPGRSTATPASAR